MKKIILAGGTGNVGRVLSEELLRQGYEVIILSRTTKFSNRQNLSYVLWDGEQLGEWMSVLEGSDTLINLSGQSIQCRFTEKNRRTLTSSRIKPTYILGEAIRGLKEPPRLWINISGTSIFEGLEQLSDEESTRFADTFLANLVKEWEKTFFMFHLPATRQVCLRLSPVLSKDFGMFKELNLLTRFGLGGKAGNGKQLISWIHEVDLINLVLWIIHHRDPSSLYHACVPLPVSNKIFMKELQRANKISFGLPLPAFLAKVGAYFKGVESDMILQTNAVSSSRAVREGFVFKFPTIKEAFLELTKNIY